MATTPTSQTLAGFDGFQQAFNSLIQKLKSLDLDAYVILSLFLQFLLVLTAPLRKHSLKRAMVLIWLPYVYAFIIANYSIGLINKNDVEGGRTGNLRVFWAPFLILHLGGPNSVTALSFSDNELWLRYAVHLITLAYTFARIYLRSSLHEDLWLPTLIMFLAALLKYMEKVICFFKARLTKLRDSTMPDPNPGVNYAKLMETYISFRKSNFPADFERCYRLSQARTSRTSSKPEILGQIQLVKLSCKFFDVFQGLFVNAMYSYGKREQSMEYFLSIDARDAFSICEVELNLAYDVVYTKAILINMIKGPYHNIASLFLQTISLLFWIFIDKKGFHGSSVKVTNLLLGGSIVLELFSLFDFLTSDWFIGKVLPEKKGSFCVSYPWELFLSFKNWARYNIRKRRGKWCVAAFKTLFCRWSESIPQHSLMSATVGGKGGSLKDRVNRLVALYTHRHDWFTDKLRIFVFDELVFRSLMAKTPKEVDEINSARGSWTVTHLSKGLEAEFSPWLSEVDYEVSLMLWHIATDICYSREEVVVKESHLCQLSKTMSDYMIYLMMMERRMLPRSSQIIGQIIYGDTFAEAKRFLDRVFPASARSKDRDENLRAACGKIYGVVSDDDVIPPRQIKGGKSRSVLFDGCLLARKLEETNNLTNKWEVISKVWAEMLFYCAAHCRPTIHLEKLSTGGELVTLVWLLMTHLGLGRQFRCKKGRDRKAHMILNAEHT